MESSVVAVFAISFLAWMVFLGLNFVFLIKPQFIFKKTEPTPQMNVAVAVTCLIFLFVTSFILGVATFLMRTLNSIVIF